MMKEVTAARSREVMADDDSVIMVFEGEYDLAAKEQLRAVFDLLTACRRAVLDFSSVTYIDSTVLCEMARMHQARAAQGYDRATLVLQNAGILRLLAVACMKELFRIVATLDEAVGNDGRQLSVRHASAFPET